MQHLDSPERPMRMFPSISNLLVQVRDDEASSTCLMTARSFPPGAEVFGEYDDAFVREDGVWRFRARRYTILRSAGASRQE